MRRLILLALLAGSNLGAGYLLGKHLSASDEKGYGDRCTKVALECGTTLNECTMQFFRYKTLYAGCVQAKEKGL